MSELEHATLAHARTHSSTHGQRFQTVCWRYATGSLEDRMAATSNIKAALCGHAGSVFSWLAHVAGSHPMPTVSSAPAAEVVAASSATDGQQDAASAELSEAILSCFNAWIRLGSLREIGMGDSQALVSLALAHLQSFTSPVSVNTRCARCAHRVDVRQQRVMTLLHPRVCPVVC